MVPASGCFLAGQHAEERGLAGAVRADDADDAARRQREGQVVDQLAVGVVLLEVLDGDDVLAEARAVRDDDLGGGDLLALGLGGELVVGVDAGLLLGLAGLGALADPFELAGQGLLAGLVLAGLLQQALGLLLEPGGVVALPGDAAAAVELEDPAGDVVEEVAVVGDDQDGAAVLDQVLLQPGDGLGVEVVGRLVEEQDVGVLEQQLAERDAALLAAGEGVDRGVVGRAAQRLHGDVDLAVEVPEVLGVDLVLEGGHLLHQLVGIVLGDLHRHLVVALEQGALGGDALHDVAADVERRVELGLLRQVADGDALGGPGLALEVLVLAGHDPQQRRLARAVDADDADLHAGQERQADVLEDLLAAGVGLGEAVHVEDVLRGGHGCPRPDAGVGASLARARAATGTRRGGAPRRDLGVRRSGPTGSRGGPGIGRDRPRRAEQRGDHRRRRPCSSTTCSTAGHRSAAVAS